MILRLFQAYKTGKNIYGKILKPFYLELRKDAYADQEKPITKRKKKDTNAKHQKSQRRNTGKTNTEGL